MKIEEGYIFFDSLVRPSRDVVGEYAPIKAKVPSFSQKNASGDAGEIDDFYKVAEIAKKTREFFLL